MTTRSRLVLLLLAPLIVLIPSAIIVLTIHPSNERRNGAPVESSKRVESRPWQGLQATAGPLTAQVRHDPVRQVILSSPVNEQELPNVSECAAALSWMTDSQAEPGGVARDTLRLVSSRTTQLIIKSISLDIVRREKFRAAAVASCSNSTWGERYDSEPGDARHATESFVVGGYVFTTPEIAIEDGVPNQEVRIAEPLTELSEAIFTAQVGRALEFPIYFIHPGGGYRIGYTLTLDLRVNGRPHRVKLGAETAPLWLYPEWAQADWRSGKYEWLTDTKRWTVDRPYAPPVPTDWAVPDTRICHVLELAELSRYLSPPREVEYRPAEGNPALEMCRWADLFGTNFRVLLTRHPTSQAAREEFEVRWSYFEWGGPGATRQPFASAADASFLANGSTVAAHHDSEFLEFTYSGPGEGSVSEEVTPAEMIELARAVTERLW
jgi:hypothetical protein